MHDIVLQLLNGLVVGSSLALVASGLALVFGVLDIVNFAQGELFMLGGYVLFFTLQATGNFGLGLLAAAVLVGLLGGAVLYGMVWPLLGRSQALPLLATLGLSLIIQQEATNTFNSTTRRVPAPIDLRIPVENVDYPVYNLAIVAISAVLLAAGYLFLKYTRYGIWLRAVAENRPMAAALGVPVPRVYFLAFALSSGLAGLAGALLAPVVSVYTTVGSDVILNAFIVVVAGGMGNFRGAAMVALLLGEVEAVGSIWFRPVEVQVFALFLVIGILVYRSRGKPAAAFRAAASSPRGASPLVTRATYALLTVGLLGLALVLPLLSENVSQRVAIYLIYGLLGVSVALITGFGRLFNIGVGAMFGLSAYTVAFLTNHDVTYPVEDGLLCAFAAEAARRPAEPHVLIIDEINRGNLPRVFGELLYLLEYREQSVRLPYSRRDFRLPGNLYLLSEDNVVGLAAASPAGYVEKGRFTIADQGLPSWAHPVVSGGRFYIRNQTTLAAYDVKGK